MEKNKFTPGERLIATTTVHSDYKVEHLITKGKIYTCMAVKKDSVYKSGYKVIIKECKTPICTSWFESAEKMMFDKEFADKLNKLIE